MKRWLATLLVGVALGSAGCGGSERPPVRPPMVPAGLVPPTVQDDSYAFHESTLPQVKEAFAKAGSNSLAADGELWELRKGDRLVGALQLTTLLPDVDLENEEHREKVLKQLLPTARDQILIDEVDVWVSETSTKTVYLWFAQDMYALLTLKPGSEDDLDPDRVVTEVVSYAAASGGWKPLYIDDEDVDL